MTASDSEYVALAKQLSDPSIAAPEPAMVRTGDEAAAAGRQMLLREFGSDEAIESAIRRGRPRLGSTSSKVSATVRGRISPVDYEAFLRLETETGQTQSELVREAVHLLLANHELTDRAS